MYKKNIKKNDFVIVQQDWLKKEFVNLFKLDKENVLVCYPKVEKKTDFSKIEYSNTFNGNVDLFTFFYPALARPFKNFEIIGEAVKLLIKKGIVDFEVIITISGCENNYSKYILKKYSHLKQMNFVGMLKIEEVYRLYESLEALIFPSTLETWGLPITEFKAYKKPIVLSRLPYAFETLGEYDKACFFDPLNAEELAERMISLINGNPDFDKTSKMKNTVLVGWAELYNKILCK